MEDTEKKGLTLREKAELLTGKAFFLTRDYPEHGIRSMRLSDGPHGLRTQGAASDHLGLRKSLPATCFPTASLSACSFDEALLERMGEALGEEAAAMDVDVLLGPGLNIKRNPLCGRNFEYFSEDPLLSGKLAAAAVRGIQKKHVSACVKHFAANNRELRRMTSDSIVDERTLREIYLYGFELAVKEGGVHAVMSSYNRINGVYADENLHLLRKILREEWGFTGAVVTDWGASNTRTGGLMAGSDLEMPRCQYGADDLIEAVEEGTLPEALLDESVERVLRLADFSKDKDTSPYNREAHRALAREVAEKSVVLLKNDGALPLQQGEKVALIGDFAFMPRYQGAGSSAVNPTALCSAEEALRAVGVNLIGTARGFFRFGKPSRRLIREALKVSEGADAVLFFAGLDEASEAEGTDRATYSIPQNQKDVFTALIGAGRRVIVVLSCGGAVETAWTEGASALLFAGLAGQEGGYAIANIVCGAVNPSGKLAESWAEQYGDYPTSTYFTGGDRVEYREGPFVGYRYFTTSRLRTAFPFGYGLSYTKFAYISAEATSTSVTVTVENTGEVAGDEIVQVYLSKRDSAIIRPARELKGFARVHLEAGERAEVTIPFNERTFAYFDVNLNTWQVEGGDYEVLIGASSEDIRLTCTVSIEGISPQPQEFPTYMEGRVKEVPPEEFYRLANAEPPKEEEGPLLVTENTTVGDLRHAKGFAGRAFAGMCRFGLIFVKLFYKKGTANTISASLTDQPLRGIAKFAGMKRKTLEGLILMFNGKFFAGLSRIIKRDRRKKA